MKNQVVKILIAEDSITQAENLRFILEERGFQVSLAQNGREALELLHMHRPTLVISDIIMPEMDGYELCRQIKDSQDTKHIPVILLTSLSSFKDILQGLRCGADHFLTKPYEKQYLLSRIQHILLNQELRGKSSLQVELEILFDGQRHTITADRVQILDMLISTFEAAVQKNLELEQANRELAIAKEKLAQQARKLEEIAISDDLTGIYNRRGFLAAAQQQLKIALRTGTPLLLFFIDLDDMKKINDSLGHQAGDQALVDTAKILKSTFREADILSRIGGDEFAILAIIEPKENVATMLKRLEEGVSRYNHATAGPFTISLSTGTAWFSPNKPASLDDLMAEADNFMYEQKKTKAQRSNT